MTSVLQDTFPTAPIHPPKVTEPLTPLYVRRFPVLQIQRPLQFYCPEASQNTVLAETPRCVPVTRSLADTTEAAGPSVGRLAPLLLDEQAMSFCFCRRADATSSVRQQAHAAHATAAWVALFPVAGAALHGLLSHSET